MILHRPLDPATKATVTPEGYSVPFQATWSATAALLQREADHLTGRRGSIVHIEVDLPTSAIRIDGGIYANAKAPATPVVAVAIEGTRQGDLRWVSAKYRSWQGNVRAVARTLEALRAVDRWGAASGEQYRGFAAIGATSTGTALGTGLTPTDAADLLAGAAGMANQHTLARSAEVVASTYRRAARQHHPDVGGDPAVFARLGEARDVLMRAVHHG